MPVTCWGGGSGKEAGGLLKPGSEKIIKCHHSTTGGASDFQSEGCGFDPRWWLQDPKLTERRGNGNLVTDSKSEYPSAGA